MAESFRLLVEKALSKADKLPVLPSDAIMRVMAQMAIEEATEELAGRAERFAQEMREKTIPATDGPTALDVFAKTIRATNKKRFPPKTERN